MALTKLEKLLWVGEFILQLTDGDRDILLVPIVYSWLTYEQRWEDFMGTQSKGVRTVILSEITAQEVIRRMFEGNRAERRRATAILRRDTAAKIKRAKHTDENGC